MSVIDVVAWVCLAESRLLVARSIGKELFYVPGGKREAGEGDVDTLVREVKEELGVDILPDTAAIFQTYRAPAHGHADDVMVNMVCYTAEHFGEPVACAEIAEIDWFGYTDRERTAEADRWLMDDLVAAGMLSLASWSVSSLIL